MNMIQQHKKQCPVRDNPELNSGLVKRNIPAKPKSRRDDIFW